MCRVFRVTAVTAVGTALLSCCAPRPAAVYQPQPPVAYAPSAPVVHAPLPPAAGYASPTPPVGYAPRPPVTGYAPPPPPVEYAPRPPMAINSPPRVAPYGNLPYARSEPQATPRMAWRTSPRWAAVKGKTLTDAAKPDPDAKFKAAQAKAAKVGVENLSNEDIEGLNLAQLKELRGY